jgi:hypothetical protein
MTFQPLQASQSFSEPGTVEVGAKVYFNGFPKSGLHLAVLMAAHMATPWMYRWAQDGTPLEEAVKYYWCGSFEPAWSSVWRTDWDNYLNHISVQPEGSWMKGHVGYRSDLAEHIWNTGQSFAFVYRDLRDVAVSMAYHVEDQRTTEKDGVEWVHPGKAEYMELPTHEDRLLAVINGLNEWPGLFERWELYAPWLDVDWVFPVRYEWLREDPRWAADLFIRYVLNRTMQAHDLEMEYNEDLHEHVLTKTLEVMADTSNSFTYRKGVSGEWAKEFTPAVKDAFKARGQDWLQRLGYESDNDW